MLELDLATVLWQAVNFLILAVALYFILFKPSIAGIKARSEERDRAAQQLEKDRADVGELRTELQARLAAAEEEAASLVSRSQNEADMERASLVQEAHAEVERILTEAQMDAYRLKRQAVSDFHDELLEAVLEVSGLVIGRVAPKELHGALVDQLCAGVWDLGQNDMNRVDALRRSLGERTPTVVARTAQALSPEQQGLVVRTFSALADRSVNIDLKVEPALGLGIQVRLGDLVIDNTIASRLDELRDSVIEALEERIANE